MDRAQARRKGRVASSHPPVAAARPASSRNDFSSNPRRNAANRAVRGASSRWEPDLCGEHGGGELAHSVSSPGGRYESASARCSGSTAADACERGDRRARLVRRARDRAPRAGAARPRASAARRPAAFAAVGARASRRRAARTRSRTGADASPGGAASSPARGRGTAISEVEAIEQRARELLAVALHAAAACTSTARHRVTACTARTQVHRRQRAGSAPGRRLARRRARPRRTPSSSGWRSASSAGRWNSGNSSRKRTPWCARLASPGPRVPPPPPTIAATEAEWCGARNGGTRTSPPPGRSTPRPSGCASPRARPRRRGAAGSRAAGARASSCPCRAARRAGGCARRRRRSRARAAPAPGRARRRDRGRRERLEVVGRQRRLGRAALAPQVGDRLGEVVTGDRLDSGERHLGARLGRADETREPGAAGAFGRDERAGDGPQPSVERELADRGVAVERSGGTWYEAASTASAIGRSNPEPSLRSAAGARLTVIRRFVGHSSSADEIPHRTRSFASWHARSASPTIAKDGHAALQVRLDLDAARVEADECVGDGACEHVATLGGNVVTCLCRDVCRKCVTGAARRARPRSTRRPAGRCGGSRAAGSAARARAPPARGSPGRARGGR